MEPPVTTEAGTAAAGFDVLVQSQVERTCRGFTGVPVDRPIRILVRAGGSGTATTASNLVDALLRRLGGLGVEASDDEMPCGGQLRDPCMAQAEPQTHNALVWIGSDRAADSGEDAAIAEWFDGRPDSSAVAVLPLGANPDVALPSRLRDDQVIWWDGNPDRAALEVLAATQLDAGERRIFISYSHHDGIELAHAVFQALSAARFAVFLDAFSLAPGVDFAERIEHALIDKAFLLLIETPEAIASDWVRHELDFARQNRLGIASVWPGEGSPRLAGIGAPRRWELPEGTLEGSIAAGGPTLEKAVADDLRQFTIARQGESLLRRRHALYSGMRLALQAAQVPASAVRRIPGGLEVDSAGGPCAVALRPRPADLLDMHSASRQVASGGRGVMVSATPRGAPERQALSWLARVSSVDHWDEGRLGSLARAIASGTA
jgi:TIR domain